MSKFAMVTGQFNKEICERLKTSALSTFKERGIEHNEIIDIDVPGAYEIPLAVKWLFEHTKVEGIVTLGTVVRGETSHYTSVCESVERGCSQLQLEYAKPVVFGVLTVENVAQAMARSGGSKEDKGHDVVEVLFEMLKLKSKLMEI